ncbi:major histocompatibility complex class I-related gene protein-like [Fundulus diaphanus]
MLKLIFLLLMIFLLLKSIAGMTHSLKYFYTASSEIQNFPEFVVVGLVDDVQIVKYDSFTRKTEPKQEWMKENFDQQYWESETQTDLESQYAYKVNIEIAKQRFNQTEGVHIYQNMYGCEWNDETGEVSGYHEYGFDGEDWIIFDMKENRWITPKPQGLITTNRWNNDRADLEYYKYYFNQICPAWLKKYVDYGRSSLMRTDLPSVSFLQKNSSFPISCHATGFYPHRAEMFWRKDGEEVHGGVVKGEILPNNDGTFQMSVDIDLSSVKPEDWNKYECVFQLSGVREDIVLRLEKTRIQSDQPNDNMWIILVVVVLLCVIGLIGVTGFFLYKKKNAARDTKTPSPEISSLNYNKSGASQGPNSSDKPLLQRKKTTN